MAYSELFNLRCTTKTISVLNNSLVNTLSQRTSETLRSFSTVSCFKGELTAVTLRRNTVVQRMANTKFVKVLRFFL